MDWRREAQADFFDTWRAAGLPDPAPYHAEWQDRTRVDPAPGTLPGHPEPVPPALHPEVVRSVHGFGREIGELVAALYDVPVDQRPARVSWCGRFNLGISLVDWLCDEAGDAATVARLPAFALLARLRSGSEARAELPPVARYLHELADRLLRADTDPRNRAQLRRMLRAELWLAATAPRPLDAARALRALRLASAGPFEVMARHTALEPAARLGSAIGDLIWLVDDVADLWRDLDAGQWNRLLARVAVVRPDLLEQRAGVLRSNAIARTLCGDGTTRRATGRGVRRFAAVLAETPAPAEVRTHSAGLLAAAIAQWFK